jgi:hypothetical protein
MLAVIQNIIFIIATGILALKQVLFIAFVLTPHENGGPIDIVSMENLCNAMSIQLEMKVSIFCKEKTLLLVMPSGHRPVAINVFCSVLKKRARAGNNHNPSHIHL